MPNFGKFPMQLYLLLLFQSYFAKSEGLIWQCYMDLAGVWVKDNASYVDPRVLPNTKEFCYIVSILKAKIVHNKEIMYASDFEGSGIEIRAGLTLRY